MITNNVMTGNRAWLKIEGATIGVGYVQSVSVSDDLGMQVVSGIGNAEGVEIVPGQVSYRINMTQMFIYNKKLIDLKYQPNNKEYLTSGALEIEIQDNVTLKTMEHYTGCKLSTSNRNYSKHSPSTQDATFIALTKLV